MASRKHLIECPHCSKQFTFVPPAKKKATPEETKLFKLCKKIWLEDIHKGWTFGGAQAGALKQIISKIKLTIDAGNYIYTEELHVVSFRSFCEKLPDFYKDKDLQILNSKYNEIVTQIQRGKTPQLNGYHQQNSGQRNKYDSEYRS